MIRSPPVCSIPCKPLYRWRAFKQRDLTKKKAEEAPPPPQPDLLEDNPAFEADMGSERGAKKKKKKKVGNDDDDDDLLAAAAASRATGSRARRPRGAGAEEDEAAGPSTGRTGARGRSVRAGVKTAASSSATNLFAGEGEDGPLGPLQESPYVLAVTNRALRLYETRRIMWGKRGAVRKGKPAEELLFASPFMADSGAGVACLTASGNLQTWSCPGLLPLTTTSMVDIVGWTFTWADDSETMAAMVRASACSMDGNMFCFPQSGDMHRIVVTNDMPHTAQPLRLFDHDVQAAVNAAAFVAELQSTENSKALPTGPSVADQYADIGKDVAKGLASLGSTLLPNKLAGVKNFKDLGNLFAQGGKDFARNVEKAAAKTAAAASSGALISGGSRFTYTCADLDVLFASALPPSQGGPRRSRRPHEEDGVDEESEDEPPERTPPGRGRGSGPPSVGKMGKAGGLSSKKGSAATLNTADDVDSDDGPRGSIRGASSKGPKSLSSKGKPAVRGRAQESDEEDEDEGRMGRQKGTAASRGGESTKRPSEESFLVKFGQAFSPYLYL